MLIPLLLGLLIYVFFRPSVTHLHSWMPFKAGRILLPKTGWSNILQYQAPDFCWAYALSSSMLLFTRLGNYACATVSIIFLSGIEYAQAGWRLAALDLADMAAMILATALSIAILKRNERHY